MGLKTFDADDSEYNEFKSLCAKEGTGVGDQLKVFIRDYIKEHGDGNPHSTMDQFVDDPNFRVTPALFRNSTVIKEFMNSIQGTPQYDEVGHQLEIWVSLYNKGESL